jgi:chromosome partitioning protein
LRVIAVINEKGGVGKTTTTANIGGTLAEAGKKVLLIDIDKQSYLTRFAGMKADVHYPKGKTINEVLLGEIDGKDAIYERSKNLWIMPSSHALADTEYAVFLKMGRELVLQKAMAGIGKFDFILIDCPPSLGLLTINALCFASELFVVMQPEPASLQGMDQLLKTFQAVKTNMNESLDVTGVIFSMVEGKVIHREIIEHLRGNLKDLVFKTVVPRRVVYTEASGQGKFISEYRPKSEEADIVRQLTAEVIKRKRK